MIQEGAEAPFTLRTAGGRNPVGWIVLALFFALAISHALSNSTSADSPKNRFVHETQQDLLQKAMSHKWFQLHTAVPSSKAPKWSELNDPEFKALDPQIGAMKRLASKDPMAVKLYAAMSYERGRTIDPTIIAPLNASDSETDRTVWRIYAPDKLSPELAEHLASSLPNAPAVYKVAKVHALEKAGIRDPLSRYYEVKTSGLAVATAITGVLSFGAMAVWILFITTLLAKTFNPRGIPMDGLSARGGDRLAIHAAVILALFNVVGIAAASLPISGAFAELAAGAALVIGILALQRVRFDGIAVSLAELGVTKENLRTNILLGVAGFLAEFPVATFLASIGERIFSFLPTPTHPASQTLQATHRLAVVIPLILFGSIITPFWEELTFRGLLFPAFRRFTGLIPAIVISSLLFGSIHPQGPALLLSLASVGAASCILSYKSRSLVPSMVMHCLHNTLIFALTLLVS